MGEKEGRKRKIVKSSLNLMKFILLFPLQSITTSLSLRKADASSTDGDGKANVNSDVTATATAQILMDDSPKIKSQQQQQHQKRLSSRRSRELSATAEQKVATLKSTTSDTTMPTSMLRTLSLSKCIVVAIFVIVVTLIATFVQGISHLLTYRNNFGNAPIPKSPSHGVVVAHYEGTVPLSTYNNNMSDGNGAQIVSKSRKAKTPPTIANHENHDDIPHYTNYTFKAFNPTAKAHANFVEQEQVREQYPQTQIQPQAPLRLLLIGDSIARGVGQAHHCKPVLPQAMAKYLSQKLNGRAVYWTTMAEPGASTKWLSQLVEEEHNKKKRMEKRNGLNPDGSARVGSADYSNGGSRGSNGELKTMHSLKQFKDRHLSTTGSTVQQRYNKGTWIENLEYHTELYRQNPFGGYDIIVVMTGLNDIKRMLVPFLLEDEVVEKDGEDDDADVAKNHATKERGFAADLKRLIQLLNMEQSPDFLNGNCIAHRGNTCAAAESSPLLSTDGQQSQEQNEQDLPMIVFPRFPTNMNPVKMGTLLRSIALYLCDLMDSVKLRIADQYENVISPQALTYDASIDYLRQHAIITSSSAEQKNDASGLVNSNEVMVNLIDVATDECERIEGDMSTFYSQRNAMDFCTDSPLLKFFAPDGLHPSDFGYNFFGQRLANIVLEKWGRNRLSR